MSRTRTRGGAQRSGARTRVFGIVLTAVIFLITALIGAVILGAMENPTAHVELCSMAALFITAASSGYATARYKGDGAILPSVLSSLFFVLVLLVIGLIGTSGRLPIVGVINLGTFMIISTLCAMLGRKRERKRRI